MSSCNSNGAAVDADKDAHDDEAADDGDDVDDDDDDCEQKR